MIVVCPMSKVEECARAYAPTHAISMVDAGVRAPDIPGVPPERRLTLSVEVDPPASKEMAFARRRAERLIDFLKGWDGSTTLLIHCHKGLCRSPAAAFIALCAANPDKDEADLAHLVRAAAPCADPCRYIIAQADELLDRDGRMIDAILDLKMARCATEGGVVELPAHP